MSKDFFGITDPTNDLVNNLLSQSTRDQMRVMQGIQEQAHRRDNPVIDVCESLQAYIKQFEAELDDAHEVGAHLVNFGQSFTLHVSQLGFSQPNLVTFYGTSQNGDKVQLVQHVSQLSVLLVAVKRATDEPKRPIGFIWS